jgi:hypothetical protein
VTAVVSISALGAFILFLGIRLLLQHSRDRRNTNVTLDEYVSAREALEAVFAETKTIKRILSGDDSEFVTRLGISDLRSLFLKERKKLALKWFSNTRNRAARLMDLHLRLASSTDQATPPLDELKMTATYLIFVVMCNIALVLVWTLGPFRASRAISYSIYAMGNFSAAVSRQLDNVKPSRLGSSRESLVH